MKNGLLVKNGLELVVTRNVPVFIVADGPMCGCDIDGDFEMGGVDYAIRCYEAGFETGECPSFEELLEAEAEIDAACEALYEMWDKEVEEKVAQAEAAYEEFMKQF